MSYSANISFFMYSINKSNLSQFLKFNSFPLLKVLSGLKRINITDFPPINGGAHCDNINYKTNLNGLINCVKPC